MLAYLIPTAEADNLGFTGHTNLAIGLVHMGGRVYDPAIGRFLSADPNVQYPLSPQSYNRYTYVNNNPLSFTDPTGYMSLGDIVDTIAIIVIAYFVGDWADGAASAAGASATEATVVAGAAGGATAGFLSTPGNLGDRLGGAAGGAASGALFAGLGASFGPQGMTVGTASYFEKAVAEGLVGGVMSEAGGGRFGDGFIGAAVGSLDAPLLGEIGSKDVYHGTVQAIVAGVIGGTVSEISGGDFGDGAMTAAFQNLYNDQKEENKEDEEAALAKMIFAEGAEDYNVPGAFEGLGSVALNRVGDSEFGGTLQDVLDQKDAFYGEKNPLAKLADNPSQLTGANVKAYARALTVAHGLISGTIKDTTGGAKYFYSGSTAPAKFFAPGLADGTLVITKQIGDFSFVKESGD